MQANFVFVYSNDFADKSLMMWRYALCSDAIISLNSNTVEHPKAVETDSSLLKLPYYAT